ncbi:MAG: DUF1573 domain-containing protein [Actinobacteria bacterium]|nr:DUF1573 domain-containing protein [Actinomycetota bacterium]MCL5882714.1 DUF1573 domain-containing protein [Actinomycetota bacterium]
MRNRIALLSMAFAALLIVSLLAGCGSQVSDTGVAGGDNTAAATAPAGASTSTAATLPDTGGRLQIAEASFDFGTVPIDTKVDHTFTIRNIGTGPLQLGPLSVKRLEGC